MNDETNVGVIVVVVVTVICLQLEEFDVCSQIFTLYIVYIVILFIEWNSIDVDYVW